MSSIPELDLYSNLPIYPELEQMEHTDSSWNENSPSTEKPEEEFEDIDVISLDDSIASPSTCGEKPAAFPCVPVPVANNTEKRLHHNFQERQRRCDLKLAFEDLRQVVLSRNPKAPKQMILDEALLRIGHLMEKEKQCITVKEFLLVQKQKLIEKLRSRRWCTTITVSLIRLFFKAIIYVFSVETLSFI